MDLSKITGIVYFNFNIYWFSFWLVEKNFPNILTLSSIDKQNYIALYALVKKIVQTM